MAHEVKLGSLIDESAQRDAVHIAVAPVIAADGEKLYPGQDIGFVGDGSTYVGVSGPRIGIVDPFLKKPVYQGDRFWMFLYPNTITSLRHDWVHPAFQSLIVPSGVLDPATIEASERWLRRFCEISDCPGYEAVIALATGDTRNTDSEHYGDHTIDDEYMHFNGRDAHGKIPEEFWQHVENVTGQKCKYKPSYFSCSC